MPFTPTHVLAVLPLAALRRPRLPLDALAIGSMIPDLPLFLPMAPPYAATHSLPGLVTACLPTGLAALLLFRRALRRPLLALLPEWARVRCSTTPGEGDPPGAWGPARAGLAILIGAGTHLLWDSFTHEGRWGTRLVPALGRQALEVGGRGVPGYKLLQYGSTAVGLPFLALLAAAWLWRRPPDPRAGPPPLPPGARGAARLALVAIPVAAAAAAWLGGDGMRYDRLGRSITSAGLALLLAALAYGLAFLALEGRATRQS